MSTESQETGAGTTEVGGQQTAAEGTPPEAGNTDATTTSTTAAEGNTEAPAEIVYAFTAPEGVTLDQERVEKFTAIAKDLKLPADKAQALVDLATEVEVQRTQEFEALKAKWADEIAQDKELGGDKLKETLATATKVYSLLPAEEATAFKAMLDTSGFGNHPSMVRLLHAVGKALSEDKFVPGSTAPPKGSAASSFFDNSNMNP